jgi:UDP-N-acetylglucosamine 4,6-dehydratase
MTNWADSTVLVTGGTGSFGQAFIKRLLAEHPPRKLIVFSRDECKQYEMSQQLSDEHRCLRFFLGDVRDKDRLYRAFQDVDIIVHAAALKQVPAAEYNPFEFVKTNVIGAANIIDAAIDRGVKKVITLSTDKAAGPVNLYGATKLCSDKLFVTANAYAGERPTRFATVRYGNVMGSRGSIIPLLKEMRKTGVLKITDKRMTRFWLTLEQGVQFVLSSLEQMRGGEIFVPKIPSMRLIDLAEALAPDCKHEVIGIRPGEKLHETLVPRDESPWCLEFDDRYIIQPNQLWWDAGMHLKNGAKPVPDGFKYSSDCNSQWLTKEDLFALLASSESLGEHAGVACSKS